MNKCTIEGCNKKVFGKGLCSKHYTRQRRHGSTDKPLTKSQKLLREGKAFCCSCKETKPLDNFCKDSQTPHGFSRRCKNCNSDKGRDRYRNNKDKYREYARKKKFGMERHEYETILSKQDGCCAVCGHVPKDGEVLSVDHCHETGDIRGLLCSNCNLGIGHFKDNIDLLGLAIKYLENACHSCPRQN
jgi:hypothetical protein